MTRILGIDTSCDETAVAIVADGRDVLAECVASQIDLHARFGGVIPEVASRSHLEALFPLVQQTLDDAGLTLGELDALAVTNRPGLVGCLLVGLGAAKGLALASGLPLVPVDHVQAHVYGALMAYGDTPGSPRGASADTRALPHPEQAPWPLASLVVSGGHTSLYASRGPREHELVGQTFDDAAGEAYDKVAALIGLGYPGGPLVDKLAQQGDGARFGFPRSKVGDLDFSFSGLKTAVLYAARGPNARRTSPMLPDVRVEDLAASFQAAVVDVLVDRLAEAAERLGAGGLLVSGGVAANSALRARAAERAAELGLPLFLPALPLATDNAVMIAGLGHHLFLAGETAGLEVDAIPTS